MPPRTSSPIPVAYPFPTIRWSGWSEPADDLTLDCPFALRIHPEADRLAADTAEWIRRSGLFPATRGQAERHFISQRHAALHARIWPEADYPRLWLANRLLTYCWWMDDVLDSPEPIVDIGIGDLVEALRDTSAGRPVDPALAAEPAVGVFRDLWSEAAGMAPPFWLSRLTTFFLDYLSVSMRHRDRLYDPARVPSLTDYLSSRNDLGAMFYATAATELAYATFLPETVYRSAEIADINMRVNHAICWANDVFGYPKENAAGDPFNLVTILATHHGMSLRQAVSRMVELINAELVTLDFLTAVATPEQEEFHRYIDALKAMVSGLLEWMAKSVRYRGTAAMAG
ncbi:terpene synthase family protein [Streptosporangium sp. OZ121]|uniref:terpene synthase family protein n=1 Tax=Streptosporangium sp. OZ121 TaxID=3444183 RepID=UPI003F79655F